MIPMMEIEIFAIIKMDKILRIKVHRVIQNKSKRKKVGILLEMFVRSIFIQVKYDNSL